jgi:hypothetical protein
VDEDSLRWEQVLEFRHDRQARTKYKRLIHWLDGSMIGKSASYIEDEIAIRLEDYEFALKKHGIKMIIGEIEGILDPAFLAGSGLTSGTIGLLTEPLLGLASQGLLFGGKVLLNVAKYLLSRDELKNSSEIAWVYDIKKRI